MPRTNALLVEDSPAYVDIYRRMLHRWDVEILVAGSAAEAKRLLSGSLDPAIIILDLKLPDDTSGELLATLESSRFADRTVAVTGYPSVGRALATVVQVIDKASMNGMREELERILGPVPDPAGARR